MIQINIKITNTIGEWHGFLQTEPNLTLDEANAIVDGLISNVNNIKHLAIGHNDKSQTVFTDSVLTASIINCQVFEY